MLLKAVRQWIRQLRCKHDERILEGICREPMTYTRQAQYYCPHCERNWVSWKLPDEVMR